MHQFIQTSLRGNIGLLTLNRPDHLNAWHSEMRAEVVQTLQTWNADSSIGAVVITGSGDRAFSAGQDLAETQRFRGTEDGAAWLDQWRSLYGAFRNMDKGVVAALNGLAVGSAFQAALLCDVRIGHPDVKMGQPEIKAGIPSPLGTWLLREAVGMTRTIELVLTGRLMDAGEAKEVGLLNRIVPRERVLDEALAFASTLADQPPIALKLNKQHFRELTEPGFEQAIESGRPLQGTAFASGEPQMMMERFFAARRGRKAT